MKFESTSNPASRRISILREDVARKIAAGEVIDRPSSVLRELLDNALDAQASRIDVEWSEGGLDLIRVADNGQGIHPDDLPLAVLPHATSKIQTEHDLEVLTSLGFRGEALASIAAVSELSIHSAQEQGQGYSLTVRHGSASEVVFKPRAKGTSVTVHDLFLNLPARRKFLKGARSEGMACRRTLEEKVLAFPEVEFSLTSDHHLEATYPPSYLLERVKSFVEVPLAVELKLCQAEWDWGRFQCIYAPPHFFRRDRLGIYVFVNRRKISDFQLSQAVQLAFGDFQPGGSFPYCYLFLNLDPSQVDFNIHPAKREVRIRQQVALNQLIIRHLREELKPHYATMSSLQPAFFSEQPSLEPAWQTPSPFYTVAPPQGSWTNEVANLPPVTSSWRYLGQVFKLYLLVEKDGKLLVVDQHAAHERLNFDQLRAQKHAQQALLVPLEVGLHSEINDFWSKNQSLLDQLGLDGVIEHERLIIRRIPSLLSGFEDEIVSFLENPVTTELDVERTFYARMACRMSVMANDELEPQAAVNLLEKVFQLAEPRCPHGRPLWAEITKETLDHLLGRTH